MDPVTSRRVQLIQQLSKPGGPLSTASPHASTANPIWWQDGAPTPERRRLHRRLIEDVLKSNPNLEHNRQAIVLAGPPGAGKSSIITTQFAARERSSIAVDPDYFKHEILRDAIESGQYESFLVPPEIRALLDEGEKIWPLELASLVHDESSYLAHRTRKILLDEGADLIVDTVLSSRESARNLENQIQKHDYTVEIVNVEVPLEVSLSRVQQRWKAAVTAARQGEDPFGARWVPSEYIRGIFPNPDGPSISQTVALELAHHCPAVLSYQRYYTSAAEHAQAIQEQRSANAELVVSLRRADPSSPLVDDSAAQLSQNLLRAAHPSTPSVSPTANLNVMKAPQRTPPTPGAELA